MSLRPDVTELMLAVDGLEEVKEVLFAKPGMASWEEDALREMNRALAILHAHVRWLVALG